MIKRVVPDNLDMPGIYIAPLMAYIEYNRFEDATDIFEFAKKTIPMHKTVLEKVLQNL